ncbi:galactosyltransferase-related protein [Micromonospora sp. b486]|uniref:galactosyltransferase-related protein n=1 Tax=Micromonospora sp. b486 TaxID=3053986 RepID=UPI00259D23EA|nr:galactosyltransferase-related protein [Micromonospora sp. b486]MDM4784669.1 galactosyltransferase-related protein [Micromonospora sp. b486]
MLGLTHNASVDHESFRRVGGFDEAMVKWGFEDLDFFYRVFHLHGAPPELFRLDADALSYHLPHFRKTSNGLASMDNMKYCCASICATTSRCCTGSTRSAGTWAGSGSTARRSRRTGRWAGRPDVLPAPLRDELAASVALVVGNGVSALDLAPGRTRSTTTRRPARRTPTCSHRAPAVQGRALDLIVNVDMWRCLLPEDLPAFLTRGCSRPTGSSWSPPVPARTSAPCCRCRWSPTSTTWPTCCARTSQWPSPRTTPPR